MQPQHTLPKTLPTLFWHFIKLQWVGFALLIPGGFAWGVQSALFPWFVQLIIDKSTLYSHNKAELWQGLSGILFALIGLWTAIDILMRLYDFTAAKVFPKFQAQIRMAFLEYTLEHSHRYFSDQFAGTIGSRISRMPEAMLNIIVLMTTIFFNVVLGFVVNSILLYHAKPVFGIISFSWFLLHFALSYYYTQRCSLYSEKHSQALTTLNGKIVDTITNIFNVKMFSHRRFEMKYNSRYQTIEAEKNHDLMYINALMQLWLSVISLVFFIVMVVLGTVAFQKEWITVGEFALVLTSLNLIGLAWYMGSNLINYFKEVGNCQEALALIQQAHEITDAPNAKPLEVHRGDISFNNVTFHYFKNRNLFKDKHVTLHAGEKVGLVGFSGSGKTTFVNLILRSFEPIHGTISIDGQNIQQVTQDSLRNQIALIPQDPSLFHRTLMENIRYGRLDATDEEVIEASKKAHCHEFIKHLEDGYETLVGERGIKLSGGQRQRIAIARAILKNAPILIMDEATSSLDSITEKYIQHDLHQLTKGRTTIIIAHRLSTLSDMDRILVFKQGKIVEEGSHKELLAQKGHYAMLWSMQAGGFLPDAVE